MSDDIDVEIDYDSIDRAELAALHDKGLDIGDAVHLAVELEGARELLRYEGRLEGDGR